VSQEEHDEEAITSAGDTAELSLDEADGPEAYQRRYEAQRVTVTRGALDEIYRVLEHAEAQAHILALLYGSPV
jgi:hypothetical protein